MRNVLDDLAPILNLVRKSEVPQRFKLEERLSNRNSNVLQIPKATVSASSTFAGGSGQSASDTVR